LGYIRGAHEFDALLEDNLALVVDDVVELQEVLADFEVALLDPLLRGLERLVHPFVGNRLVFLDAKAAHDGIEPLGGEDTQQVVFKADVEFGAAGVALTSGTATELVVDAAALVAFRRQHIESAGLYRLAFPGFDV